MAKYTDIVEWLKHYINSSNAKPGDKIPTELSICEELGASRQTVRKAIAELTREGILTSVKGSGTYINKCSPRCYQTTSKNIAVVVTFLDAYIFPQKLSGMYSVFSNSDYLVTIFSTNNSCDGELKSIRSILNGDFAGVLLEPSRSTLPRSNEAPYQELFEKLPVILMDTKLPNHPLPLIALDDLAGGYLATKHLLENGHRDILHIGKLDDGQGILRYNGYANALSEYDIPASDDHLFWFMNENSLSHTTPEKALYEHLDRNADILLTKLKTCTAVFCYNDIVTEAFLSFAKKYQLRIPEDVSIISYDDSHISVQHGITCISHPKGELGKTAAEHLLQYIESPVFQPGHIFSPSIIVRNSVKNLN